MGRTDHWLRSLDDFLRTYSGEQIQDFAHRPRVFQEYGPLQFPFNEPNAPKMAGVTEDKIQFFSQANLLASDQVISKIMASHAFSGDALLVSDSRGGTHAALKAGDRVRRHYEVLRYDANNILIRVDGAKAGEWLYYADCWHPFWHAAVNGKEAPYYKANLAYKTVRLEEGQNLVQFRFHSTMLSMFMTGLNWNGLIWVVMVLCLIGRECTYPENRLSPLEPA